MSKANYVLGLLGGIISGMKTLDVSNVILASNLSINLIQQQEQEIGELKAKISNSKKCLELLYDLNNYEEFEEAITTNVVNHLKEDVRLEVIKLLQGAV